MKMTRRQALHGLAATIAGMSTARFIGSDDVVAQAIAKAKPLNIKVTDVRVWTTPPRSTFVKIYTNQQGLIGLGQAHMSGKEPTVAAAILQLREQLIGRDPTAIEANWEDFYEGVRWRGGPLTGAISAVDNACWDILGQALGQPIYKILGGPIHDKVKVYGGGGGITPESWAETKALGYTTSRVGWPQGNVTQMIKYVHQLREACGPDYELAIHGSGIYSTPDVVSFMRGVEDCNLLFVEEPLQMDDIGDWRHLRSHTTTPIATGERLQTIGAFTPVSAGTPDRLRSARPARVRRHHRRAEDRGHRRGKPHPHRSTRPAGSGRRDAQPALRCGDAELLRAGEPSLHESAGHGPARRALPEVQQGLLGAP